MGCDPKLMSASAAMTLEPEAAAAVPAATPVAQRLTFDADTLFDVDKSVLRPEGRAALNRFVDKVKGINPETIMVVGHASRPGSVRHNQVLSEERAESVKAYLVRIGMAPYRVQTSGVGETQPVTFAGECLSDMSTKAIACRQPDRRVDIQLIGAKISQ
jgi:OOP family OmpA-OmpF porin